MSVMETTIALQTVQNYVKKLVSRAPLNQQAHAEEMMIDTVMCRSLTQGVLIYAYITVDKRFVSSHIPSTDAFRAHQSRHAIDISTQRSAVIV